MKKLREEEKKRDRRKVYVIAHTYIHTHTEQFLSRAAIRHFSLLFFFFIVIFLLFFVPIRFYDGCCW